MKNQLLCNILPSTDQESSQQPILLSRDVKSVEVGRDVDPNVVDYFLSKAIGCNTSKFLVLKCKQYLLTNSIAWNSGGYAETFKVVSEVYPVEKTMFEKQYILIPLVDGSQYSVCVVCNPMQLKVFLHIYNHK